jgi:hypothetical protein
VFVTRYQNKIKQSKIKIKKGRQSQLLKRTMSRVRQEVKPKHYTRHSILNPESERASERSRESKLKSESESERERERERERGYRHGHCLGVCVCVSIGGEEKARGGDGHMGAQLTPLQSSVMPN